MTDDTRRLRELIQQWRERAVVNQRTAKIHPEMAEDLLIGAQVWCEARLECADQLEALLLAGEAAAVTTAQRNQL